jgi:hypothetical protein
MSLRFEFPVEIEEIYDLLTDPDFLVDRNVALGDIDSECEVEETDSNLLIKMKRTRKLDLPAFLANVLGGNPVFSTEEQWQVVEDRFEGRSTTVVGGQAGTVRTEFTLSPTRKGCEYKISHSAKIKIPVVGRKVEKYIVNTAAGDVKKEMDYLRSALGS